MTRRNRTLSRNMIRGRQIKQTVSILVMSSLFLTFKFYQTAVRELNQHSDQHQQESDSLLLTPTVHKYRTETLAFEGGRPQKIFETNEGRQLSRDASSRSNLTSANVVDVLKVLEAAYLVTRVTSTLYSSRRRSMTSKLERFRSAMNASEKALLLETARTFKRLSAEYNVTYLLYGGTLLGSYRHHDVIPWDDDFDVLVDAKRRRDLLLAVRSTDGYEAVAAGPRVKIFSTKATRTSPHPWRWPYVDVSFYEQNDTHIWDSAGQFNDYVYPKRDVFPLHERPLADSSFFAPRDSYRCLKLTYKCADCASLYYSHKYERSNRSRHRTVIPCDVLKASVPFVHRQSASGGRVLERLVLGNLLLREVLVEEPPYAISLPYKLELISQAFV